ncbi:MAG: methyltransferase domain-containing protein [Bacteroidales bacterium]
MQRNKCYYCGCSKISSYLNLGKIAHPYYKPEDALDPQKLELGRCDDCGFFQLTNRIHLDDMYRKYWYRSSANNSMVQSLKDIFDDVMSYVNSSSVRKVIDIGCNDGTFLSFYDSSVYKIGVDPALNIEKVCHIDHFVNDYFPTEGMPYGDVDIISSIAMFYDVLNPRTFVKEVHKSLKDGGLWVMQMTDFTSMLECVAFDNICHEHICYYTLSHFVNLCLSCDLVPISVSKNNVNGRSIRVICRKSKEKISNKILQEIKDEEEFLSEHIKVFPFAIEQRKHKLFSLISQVKEERGGDCKIAALGASTKGNTLLQYFKLDNNTIHKIYEISKDKIGGIFGATNIPIEDESMILRDMPDCIIVLPWHFTNITKKHSEYLKRGGKFILPLPTPKIIDWSSYEK